MKTHLRLLLPACLGAFSLGYVSAQSTWTGTGGNANWSTAGNWDVVPINGANLVFASGTASGTTLNNDAALTSAGSITFTTGDLTLTGGALSLSGGVSKTAGNLATVENALSFTANQDILASSATLFTGNWTSLAGITVSLRGSDPGTEINNAPGVPTLRIGGSNSGFMGSLNFRRADNSLQRSSATLMSPAAMIGGNINMTDAQRLFLGLNGNGVATPYTFGLGTGNGEISMGGSNGGIQAIGGNVSWRPNGSGNYAWANTASNRLGIYANVSGDFSRITWGAAGENLVLTGANKTIEVGGNSSAFGIAYTLSDDGSNRNLTKSGNGLLILSGGNAAGAAGGSTTVSGGGLSLSNTEQIFNGNFNLSGGALVFNGMTWAAFAADRPTQGSGANQWQLGSGGGFAARGSNLTIDATGTSSTTFDASFALGSSIRESASALYANAGVILNRGPGNDTVALSAATDRTWIVRGANQEGNNWTITDVVNEVAGKVTGGGAGRQWNLRGVGTHNSSTGGTLQISNAANDFQATIVIGGSNGGGMVAVFTDDGAFGHAANAVRVVDAGSGPDALLMFRDLSGAGKTFDRTIELAHSDGSSDHSGFGSYSGLATYTGAATYTGTKQNTLVQVRDGSLTLGTDVNSAQLLNTRTIAGATMLSLRKGMAGTLVLENVAYAGNVKWVLHGGTLVTTKNPAGLGPNPAGQLRSDGTQFLLSDILNGNSSTDNGTTWRISGESQTYGSLLGGGFGGNTNLQVDNGLTLRMDMDAGAQLTSAEIGPNTNGFSWGMTKTGNGIWEYRTTANSLGTPGRLDGYVRVSQGTFDQQGSMGRTGIWVDGGTYLAGNNSQFTGSNRLQVNGGKLGVSTAATANISRSTAFDGVNNIWNLGGSGTVTLASRDNFNLAMTMAFPTINAGERLIIERDGVGTGLVQLGSGTGLSIDGTLVVRGELSTASLTVGATGVVEGSGRINATLAGAGLVAPGASPGILSVNAVDGSAGTDFAFEFTQSGEPTWANAAASGNDVLRLTAATPFVNPLDGDNTLRFYFDAPGTYQGGFFTDNNADFTAQVAGGDIEFYIAFAGGGELYNGTQYNLLPGTYVTWDVVQVASADFAGGTVTDGWTMEFAVSIPEPGTMALLALGLGCAALLGRRRR